MIGVWRNGETMMSLERKNKSREKDTWRSREKDAQRSREQMCLESRILQSTE